MRDIRPWDDLGLEAQKEAYEKQALAWEYRGLSKEWLRVYVRMVRALIEAFGEEEVLDILEEVWWDLQYEGGRTWREDFEEDPERALEAVFQRWHEGEQSLTSGVYDVELEEGRWHVLVLHCKQREVALELDARKIIISQCMSDLAAVRGWCPRVVMAFPNAQLRGDPYCYQIRELREEACDPSLDHWSRELSEAYGWRSIRKLEEG